MAKYLAQILFMLLIITAFADDYKVVVSEDGWQSAVIGEARNEISNSFTTDVVPYNLTPDWICNVQMQAGGLAMGDLDSDLDLDLAVGCYQSQSSPPYPDARNFILYNINGQLQSTPSWWAEDSSSTTDVRIADINDDGFPDIFSGNGGFAMSPSAIYFYGENDSINTHAGWYSSDNCWTTGAALCDFDGDGDVDVATANQGVYPDFDRPVNVFINDDGTLETSPSWSSADEALSGYVAWGDYNNDSWPDLAVSKWSNWYSCVYRNNEGVLGINSVWQADNDGMQKGIGWSDVNGDYYPELVIGGNSMPAQLYPNNDGTLGASPSWQSDNSFHGCQDLAWADVDGDGDEDLATVHFSNGHLRIYLNVGGQLETSPSWQYDDPASGTAVTFGDINGDGAVDLVMGVAGDYCVKVFYNLGPISAGEYHNLPSTTKLEGNYPNPFNTETVISFNLENETHFKLNVYDIGGRLVNVLLDESRGAGRYSVTWNGKDTDGNDAATGVYFYSLQTHDGIYTQKMVMLK